MSVFLLHVFKKLGLRADVAVFCLVQDAGDARRGQPARGVRGDFALQVQEGGGLLFLGWFGGHVGLLHQAARS